MKRILAVFGVTCKYQLEITDFEFDKPCESCYIKLQFIETSIKF